MTSPPRASRAMLGKLGTLAALERFMRLKPQPRRPRHQLPQLPNGLSESERHIIMLVLEGGSNGDIARIRGTSTRTVANLLARAFRKLGVGSRAALAAVLLKSEPGAPAHPPAPPAPLVVSGLSPRETLVLSLVAEGHSNKRIAYDLGLSVSSIGCYVGRASAKLGATSRIDLVRTYRERCARELSSSPKPSAVSLTTARARADA